MKGFALPFCAKLQPLIHFIHSMFCWEESAGICLRKVRGDSFHQDSCHLCREVCFMTGECFVDRALVSTSSWSAPDVSDAKLVKMAVLMPKISIEIRMGPSLMASNMECSCNCLHWIVVGKNSKEMMNTTGFWKMTWKPPGWEEAVVSWHSFVGNNGCFNGTCHPIFLGQNPIPAPCQRGSCSTGDAENTSMLCEGCSVL